MTKCMNFCTILNRLSSVTPTSVTCLYFIFVEDVSNLMIVVTLIIMVRFITIIIRHILMRIGATPKQKKFAVTGHP